MGPHASPGPLLRLCLQAEELGFGTLWAADRLMYPVEPRNGYPVSPDGRWPEQFKRCLDPLETLTWLAARTSRIRLGTAVLNIPFYNPVVLGRRLVTLDILSQGRLTVGLGQGWSEDEFEAVGTTGRGRGARADEFLQVLDALWGPDPVSYRGEHYRLAPSVVAAKPLQKPRPPVFMAAFAPAALARVARLADGWLPVGMPLAQLARTWAGLQDLAAEAGRKPGELRLVVGSFPHITATPAGADRGLLQGAPGQLRSDLEDLAALGAEEVYVAARGEPDDNMALLESVRELAEGL